MVETRQPYRHYLRVMSLLQLRKYDTAAREAQRGLQQDPDDERMHGLLAWVLFRQGKFAAAEHAVHTALGLAPDNPESHSVLAVIYTHTGRHQEAEVHHQKAIALAPRVHVYHCRYAGSCLFARQWATALKEADEALRLAPRDLESLAARARALCQLGRLDEAEETARQALVLGPNWPGAHHTLGHIYQARGQLDRALISFRESLRLDPTSQPYKRCLARAVGAKFPILGALWRGTLKRRRCLFQAFFWIHLALSILLMFAVMAEIVPFHVGFVAVLALGAFPWLVVAVLWLLDRTLTAVVMKGWIK